MSQRTPPTRAALRLRILLTVLIVLVVGATTCYGLRQLNQPADDDAAVPPPATSAQGPEPVCRADDQFVAGFMSPQADDEKTVTILERINTDAATFGGRIVPANTANYPEEVTEAIGDRADRARGRDGLRHH